jgi:hypothetical protein
VPAAGPFPSQKLPIPTSLLSKPWLGVSDHTPLIDRMIKYAVPDSAFNSSIRTEKSVCSSFAGGFSALQKLMNSKTERYS